MGEPIWIPCEGSKCSPCYRYALGGVKCSMCGEDFSNPEEGMVPRHRRKDVLAMLKRGDFNG